MNNASAFVNQLGVPVRALSVDSRTIQADTAFLAYPGDADDNEGNAFAAANLRLDISEATQVTTSLTYSYSQEDDGSAESSGGTDDNQQ